jgi:DNA-binding NarL/FixJ family response regulator
MLPPSGDGRQGARVIIRVMIVDDHAVTRNAQRLALSRSDEVEVVGEASSGEEAVDAVADLEPDVVFMDVRMPGLGGVGPGGSSGR